MMGSDWDEALKLLETIDDEDIPQALGMLEMAHALLWRRLNSPARTAKPRDGEGDYNLRVEDVRKRLGDISPSWVYEHKDELGGKKIGGALRFSEAGLRRYLARQS